MRKPILALEEDSSSSTVADSSADTSTDTSTDANVLSKDDSADTNSGTTEENNVPTEPDTSVDSNTDTVDDGTEEEPEESSYNSLIDEGDVELADTDDLQVERLAKLQDREDLKALRKESYDRIAQDNNDAEVLMGAMEALKVLRETKYFSLENHIRVNEAIETMSKARKRLKLSPVTTVSLENYACDSSIEVTMESFVSTLKAIIRSIIETLKTVVMWLVNGVKSFFEFSKRAQEANKRISKDLIEQRNQNKMRWKKAVDTGMVDPKGYITNPRLFKALSYQGKLPGSGMEVAVYDDAGSMKSKTEVQWPEAFEVLIDLLKAHEFFKSDGIKKFFKYSSDAVHNLKSSAEEIVEAADMNAKYMSLGDEIDFSLLCPVDVGHYQVYEHMTAADGMKLKVRDGLIGNYAYVCSVPAQTPSSLQALEYALSNLECEFVSESSEITDPRLPYIETETIVGVNKIINELCEQFSKMRRSIDVLRDNVQEQDELFNFALGMLNTVHESNISDGVQMVKSILTAAMKINVEAKEFFNGAMLVTQSAVTAWNIYLFEAVNAEKSVVDKTRAMHM